jgi:hypothetical protein
VADHHARVFTAQTKSLRQSDSIWTLATQISSAAHAEHRLHSALRFVIALSVIVNELRYVLHLSPGSDYGVTLSA